MRLLVIAVAQTAPIMALFFLYERRAVWPAGRFLVVSGFIIASWIVAYHARKEKTR